MLTIICKTHTCNNDIITVLSLGFSTFGAVYIMLANFLIKIKRPQLLNIVMFSLPIFQTCSTFYPNVYYKDRMYKQ